MYLGCNVSLGATVNFEALKVLCGLNIHVGINNTDLLEDPQT